MNFRSRVSLSLALLTCTLAHADIRLTGRQWNVLLDPPTLSAIAQFPGGTNLPISTATPHLGPATITNQADTQAAWTLPTSGLRVEASLLHDRLTIRIIADKPGKFTWPVLTPDPRLTSLILPRGEGFSVPVDQKPWRDFVAGESPFQTMADLTLPLWGLNYQGRSLTYILTNPMDNALAFEDQAGQLAIRLTHHFQRNSPDRQYGLMIVPGGPSPVEPARIFRDWLIETGQFVSLRQKIAQTPAVEALLGAAHAYLWAGGVLDFEDVLDWPGLLTALRHPANAQVRDLASQLPPEIRGREPLSLYLKTELLNGLNRILEKQADRSFLNQLFPHLLADSTTFGGAISPKMIGRLKAAGFDRLWLGVSDLDVLRLLPETVAAAKEAGFLFAPYDSYHTIHSPDAKTTWPTAQFGRTLYDQGAIIQENGQRDRGFQGTGSHLSSVAVQPYVPQRVGAWMKQFGFNSYFVDCDATGELFDNYSPQYPATKQLDMELRLERMAWIRDTYHAVVGSEIGAWFAAPVIHFGQGMLTPVFGFGDPLLHDPQSPYFLGRWYPESAPDVFLKPTVLPAKYKDIYFNEKYRIPLYQTAFHDSIVTTHHWTTPSLKFTNVLAVNELLELLYGVPPLYHLTLEELKRREPELRKHAQFFSPNYRTLALLPLSNFDWLTPDREVQQTQFGDEAVVVANFSHQPYIHPGHTIPPLSVLLLWTKTGQALLYTSTL